MHRGAQLYNFTDLSASALYYKALRLCNWKELVLTSNHSTTNKTSKILSSDYVVCLSFYLSFILLPTTFDLMVNTITNHQKSPLCANFCCSARDDVAKDDHFIRQMEGKKEVNL